MKCKRYSHHSHSRSILPQTSLLRSFRSVQKLRSERRFSTAQETHRSSTTSQHIPRPGKTIPSTPNESSVEAKARKYLKKFLLKVHPDFFASWPERQKINQQSLSTLNALLDTAHALGQTSNAPKFASLPIGETVFKFYTLGNTPAEGIKEAKETMTIHEDIKILPYRHQKRIVETKLGDVLYSLFVQSGIEVAYADRWDSQSEEKFNWDHSRDKRWVTIKDMKEKNLIEEFRKYLNHAKKDGWYLTQDKHGKEPVDERFFNPELIFFEGDVTKAERKLAMKHLYGFKKRIDEKVNMPWDDIPILVTKNEWRASSEQGFLTIPVHITVSKFVDYLNTYLPSIRLNREKLRIAMEEVLDYKRKMVQILNLDGMSFHKKIDPRDRLTNLKFLNRLSEFDWDEMHLFVGEKYDNSPNEKGAIMIPYNFVEDELIQFISSVDFNKLKEANRYSMKHSFILESIAQQICRILNCGNVVYSSQFTEEVPKQTQLELLERFIEECSKIEMKKVNLTPITLVIGEDYFFDPKDKKELHLPINFTIADMKEAIQQKKQHFVAEKLKEHNKAVKILEDTSVYDELEEELAEEEEEGESGIDANLFAGEEEGDLGDLDAQQQQLLESLKGASDLGRRERKKKEKKVKDKDFSGKPLTPLERMQYKYLEEEEDTSDEVQRLKSTRQIDMMAAMETQAEFDSVDWNSIDPAIINKDQEKIRKMFNIPEDEEITSRYIDLLIEQTREEMQMLEMKAAAEAEAEGEEGVEEEEEAAMMASVDEEEEIAPAETDVLQDTLHWERKKQLEKSKTSRRNRMKMLSQPKRKRPSITQE